MYLDYFGFKHEPFSISPDPRFLFMSERHREALAHLLYGMQSDGGFVLLTGDIGTGKTTICRCLLEQLPEATEVALLLNPKLTAVELLATICDELHIPYPAGTDSIKVLTDAINGFLLDAHSRGRHTVVIIDEAQNLQPEVLEQIRLLTNLETNTRKLLQIILLGQPELRGMLDRPELCQLAQRITARYHLAPLTGGEVGDYVRHRLAVAGVERPIFAPATLRALYRLSRGVPRLINVLCGRALLGAYVRGEDRVSPALLRAAAREVLSAGAGQPRWRRRPLLLGAVLLLVLAVAGGMSGERFWPKPVTTQAEIVADPPVDEAATADAPTEPSAAPGAGESIPPTAVAVEPMAWVGLLTEAGGEAPAYQALFASWGATYLGDDPDSPAVQGARQGLALLPQRGSLADLWRLNVPALLKIADLQGEPFWAALTGLDREWAILQVGETTCRVAVGELARQWSGEFVLLWRPPPGYRRALLPGGRDPVVPWLEERLRTLNGREESFAGEVYGGALVQEVQAFQRAEGLEADGLVGPLTLIRLNAQSGDRQPQLIVRQKE